MSKILELRTKRNTLWEQTKDFLEKNRSENGLVKAEAVEQYNKMAQEVKDLGARPDRERYSRSRSGGHPLRRGRYPHRGVPRAGP